jgi:hypothetical protein
MRASMNLWSNSELKNSWAMNVLLSTSTMNQKLLASDLRFISSSQFDSIIRIPESSVTAPRLMKHSADSALLLVGRLASCLAHGRAMVQTNARYRGMNSRITYHKVSVEWIP